MLKMNELDEMRCESYESFRIFKENVTPKKYPRIFIIILLYIPGMD